MIANDTACLGPPVLASPARTAAFVKAGLWGNLSLPTVFARHVDASPDALALSDGPPLDDDGPRPRRQLTFGEVDHAVRLIAARLDACGLTPGDIVALQLPPQVEAPITMLACLGLGYIVCPLPFSWRRLEIEPAIARIGARAIVTWSDGPECGRVAAACAAAFQIPSIRFVFAFGDHVPDGVTPLSPVLEDPDGDMVPRRDFPLSVDPNSLAVITWDTAAGAPARALARSHNECIAAATSTIFAAALCQRATILTAHTLSTLAGLAGAFVPWLMTGGLMVLHRPFDPDIWSGQVSVYEPDLIVVPASLAGALSLPAGPAGGSWSTTVAAVRQVGAANQKAPTAGPGIRVVDLLCLGESALLARRIDNAGTFAPDTVALGTIAAGGSSGPMLLETVLAPGAPDEPRQIMARGAQTPSAILANNGDGHRFGPADVDDGFVATGLYAREGENRTCVLTARAGVVRHGSSTVALAELDELYASCDGLADAVALAIDDATMGARLVAAVVPKSGQSPDLAGLVAHLGQLGVAGYKLPERLVALDAIPRDAAGAVERAAIVATL